MHRLALVHALVHAQTTLINIICACIGECTDNPLCAYIGVHVLVHAETLINIICACTGACTDNPLFPCTGACTDNLNHHMFCMHRCMHRLTLVHALVHSQTTLIFYTRFCTFITLPSI